MTVLAGTTLAMVMFVLMPFGTFHLSADEFQLFGRQELLFYAVVALLIATASVSFLLLLFLRFAGRLFPIAVAAVFALAIVLYVQGNLIGLDYGLLDGNPIDWESLRVVGLVNSCVWVFGIVFCVGIFFWTMRRNVEMVILAEFVFFCYILILVACCFCFSPDGKNRPARLDDANLMELSLDRNLVVFVVDSFDRGLFDLALDRYPDVRKNLSGFTYFHNTIGRFSATSLSLPQLITGHRADPPDGEETRYRDLCYADAPFLDAARRNGFEVDLYADPSVGPLAGDVRRLGCFGNADAMSPALWSAHNIGSFRSLLRVSLFKYLPHAFKPAYWEYLMKRGFGCANADGEEADVRTERILDERLKSDHPLAITTKRKVKIYHLRGVHVPKFNLSQAQDSIGLIRRYVSAVAQAGLADRTAFVVIGDHGVLNRAHPIFLCSNGGDTFVEDARPVSYRRMGEIWTSGLTNRIVSVSAALPSEMRPSSHDRTIFRKNFIEDPMSLFYGRTIELIRLAPSLDTVGDRESERIVWNGQPGFLAIPIAPVLRGKFLEATFEFETEDAAVRWSKLAAVHLVNESTCAPCAQKGRSCVHCIPVAAIDSSGVFVRLMLPQWPDDTSPPPIVAISLASADS